MINSPYSLSQNPDDKNETPSDITQNNNFWRWLTYLILLSLGGGVSYSWYFFTQQLIPSIEKSVTDFISRPVKLGKIEAISFNTIRLGESSIETTKIENDFVIAEGVEIKFNPLQLLANQEINIGLNILNPQGFLQQNKDDSWIQLNLNDEISNEFLGKSIHINNISLIDGFINIKSRKSQGNYQENITKINLELANINFEKNKQFFEVNGRLNNQNKIAVTGLHYPEKTQWLLRINTENLATNILNDFVELPVGIDSGDINGDFSLNFVQEKLENLEANLDFNLVNLTLPNIANKLTKSAGNLQIRNEVINLKNVETNLDLIPAKVNGSINNNQLNLQVSAKNPLEISQVFSSLKIDTGDLVTKGKIAADLTITGDINQPKIATKIRSVGKTQVDKIIFDKISADFDIFSQGLVINNFELLPTIGGKVNGNGKVNLSKKDDSFSLAFRGIDIEGEKVATLYQQELPMKIGLVNGDYQLFGNWHNLSQSKLTGNSSLELETGKAMINNFEINPDTWRGEVKVSGVRLTQLPNLDCEKFGCDDSLLNGEFFVRGRRQEITAENIDLTGKFNFDLAGGRVIFHNTSLTQGSWQTQMTLDNLSLSQLPSLNLSSGSIETAIITGELRAGGVLNKDDEMMIQGKGNLFLPQGKVEIDNFTLQKDNFTAQTNLTNFSLADFGDNFRGGVTGEISWRGDVNNLTADNLNLEGNLIFSQGIDIIHQPLFTDFIWNGKALEIQEVRFDRTAPLYDKVYGRGRISYDKETETLKEVNLEIIAKGIDLKTLPLPSSLDVIKYQGNIDFQGRLMGDISQPNLTGKINLNKFQLANIDFSPLTGNLTTSAKKGINIKLDSITAEDKLYIDIDNQNQPQKIEIQNNNSRIEAVRKNETLAVTANNIPLDKVTKTWLTYLPDDIKKIGGNFSADIEVNLIDNNFIASNILIEKPIVNNFQGDTLTTKLISEGDVIKIEEGKIQHRENEYLFNGELISLANNPQVKGKVEIKEGDIQNFLRSWEIFDLKDFSSPWQPQQYGKAKDLYSSPVVSHSANQEEKTTLPVASHSDNSKEKLTSLVVSNSDNQEEKSTSLVVSNSDNQKEKSHPPVASNSDNQEEKLTSPVASHSDNSKEKLTSPVVFNSDNSKEKSTSPVVFNSDNSKEKSTSPVVSNSDNQKEKSHPPVVFNSDNSKEKSTSPVASNSDNQEEKSTSPVVSNSDNQEEKSTSPVVSNSDNQEEKSTSPVASHSDNQKEKSHPPVVSNSDNQEEKSTSPVVSNSDNQKEKLTSPVVSHSDNSKEKSTSPVVSNSVNQEEKSTSPVVSNSDNQKEKSHPPVVFNSDNSKEKSTSPVASNSDNQEEKSTSPVASHSDNQKEKSHPPVVSNSDNQEEKSTSPVVSNSDNQEEKSTSPVASHSDNQKEKSHPPVVSNSDNQEEKSTSPVVSNSDNQKEKLTSPVVSHSDNSKEKSTSPVVSNSVNQEEKSTSPVVSNSANQEEKSTSPVVSNSANQEEKSTSPVVSNSDNQEEKLTSPVVSHSDNQEEKLTSPVVSHSANQEEKLTSPVVSHSVNQEEKSTSSVVSNFDNEFKPLASIHSDEDSLLDTLDLFGKIQAELKQQQANRIHANIPVLEDLDGKFRGNVDFSFSFNNGFQGEFDFRGDDWQWGKYQANFVQASGSFGNGLLTLLPIQIQNNDSILSLSGTYSKERISGDIKLSDFSISQLKEIISLPNNFNIEGNINATIAISGSEKKPLAKGNIEIIDSKINGTKIDETRASFGFRNSRFDFLANSNLTDNSQPLKIIGSLPFQLFPNSIIADNNEFQVSLNLAKEGFSLLNIVTNNQLNWLSGNGNINLDINGKYYQLTNTITNVETQGIATFENGVIDGKILADKSIKDINGEVLFDFSQLTIPNLTGNFNGGNIHISGSLPIIDSGFSNEFLTISIDDLALDIDNLYQGNTQAMVFIRGSSIEPKIGGKIKLYNGEISLNNKFNDYQNNSENNGILSNVKIDNLDLTLGNNISITQSPLLYLKAEGSLKLNGDLSTLNPEGIINLTGGNLNLFTSQFNLANGNNIAKFTPDNGFNPYLDIQLESRVTETNRYKLTNNYHPNEIEDFSNSSFNTAQTVRINASIKGWSDNLENNIILSSSPQRNQTEIIALLGGGFFDNFTEGDSSLGLANLASAALLGSVQGQLQQNFGFNQLRLFPTQIFDSEKRTSSLAFGAELGLDITKDFSLSITKILTDEQAPQYNILYRLNDKTILRGSSDFDRDSRGVVEFEHRF
ncbi:translocation/assembly module TamB domain-containing protein [Geminocystis herdmanii]|uniref:translocation/assembly module TamB domain-containing protein n=1 Tax=Geminocystis herdmanii TaxID=669359 RepID=UPI00034D39C0|nr:translocation/assembly module TamB domain-containing protein [Geminocystis herdmanii]